MKNKITDVSINKKTFYQNLARLALPISLQSLMLASVAAGDALMLGKVAQNEMTAVSLATQIQFVQNMFLSAITGAGAILGAQYWGKGDKHTLEDIFNMMLRIAGWSYLLTGISQCYLTMMKVSEHVKPGAVISSCAVLLNIGLNAVFIFGLFGAPRMQARGAALATTISRMIELALCLAVSAKASYIRPAFDRFIKLPRQLKADFARQCLPLMGGCLCWGVGFTSYTAIMGHMGTDAAAANSVSAVARDLICCMCNGIGSAAGIMVGNELGAGRLAMGKAYGTKLKNISYVIGFLSTALVLAVTPLVLRMVILTPQAREYLLGMMVIMSIYMIGRCVNTVTINGVLDGGGDTLFDMYSLIVCMWMIAIPLALIGAFVLHWSPLAVYACTCLDEVGKIPWVMLRFRKYKWVQDLTR